MRGPLELLPADASLDEALGGNSSISDLLAGPGEAAVPEDAEVMAPVGSQEIWAAGVTFPRSRDARKEESSVPDHYDLVYDGERPELFLKALPGRVRGPGETIGIRSDSTWDVPEPELGLVIDARGQIVAYTIGNDVSSRSIEGANPLYLPQAKVYQWSCSIGPCLVPVSESPPLDDMDVSIRIYRNGDKAYSDKGHVGSIRRQPEELVSWLMRGQEFETGAILLTGTALVPDMSFTLEAEDEVVAEITGLGELSNPVVEIEAGLAPQEEGVRT